MTLIRNVAMADAAGVAALLTQLGYETGSEGLSERLRSILDSTDCVTLVAESDVHVAGLVGARLGRALEFDGLFARLTGLVVDEPWRGRGLGRRLMEEIEARTSSMGATILILTSGSHRTEAHEFYAKMGYDQTGIKFAKRLTPSD